MVNFDGICRYSIRVPIFLLVVFFYVSSIDALSAATLEKPEDCLVCGKSHDIANYVVYYKGMEFPLCSSGCLDHYSEAASHKKLDSITAKIEPRAALFQEDSNQRDPLAKTFFWLGYYVLIGLVFGGLASYAAVQRGFNPWSGFIIGFFLNVIGFIIVFSTPMQKMQFSSVGLTKVPKTRNEVICSGCGHSNHPSAKTCIECGQKFKSRIRSEVQAVGLRKGM